MPLVTGLSSNALIRCHDHNLAVKTTAVQTKGSVNLYVTETR